MTRSPHRALPRLVGACMIIACVCGAAGCTTVPEPRPSELIDDELDTVFDAVRGEEAIRAILVFQDGGPVYERYLDASEEDTWDTRDVTATVTSTLIGIAIDQGLIPGVHATLGELLPDYASSLTPETTRITLHAVLTHTANFASGPDVPGVRDEADWVRAALADRARQGPGDETFRYSRFGMHVLSAIVAETTGMTPLDYARENLFDPLGIDTSDAWEEPFPAASHEYLSTMPDGYEAAGFAWPTDPAGLHLGADMLRLRPQDLELLGRLFLDRGTWKGEQIVSKSWVNQATWPIVETGDPGIPYWGYGFGVNDGEGVFLTEGAGGTVVAVNPVKDAVVVIASEIAPDDDGLIMGAGNVSARSLAFLVMDRLPR